LLPALFGGAKIIRQIAPLNIDPILIVIFVDVFKQSLVVGEDVRDHLEIFVLKIIA
jgi:hypothetical protein